MKTMSKRKVKQAKTVDPNIFREMFELRIQLEEKINLEHHYREEFIAIIRSIDHLFDQMLKD